MSVGPSVGRGLRGTPHRIPRAAATRGAVAGRRRPRRAGPLRRRGAELERLAADPGVPPGSPRTPPSPGGPPAPARRPRGAGRATRAACAWPRRRPTLARVGGVRRLRRGLRWRRRRAPDDGVDAAAARIDALVGLAADAVGLGDPAAAERLLAVAAPALAAHPSWRPGPGRLGAGRAGPRRGPAGDAVAPAEAALAAAGRGGSLRHVLKSRIVLAVAAAPQAVDDRRGRRRRVGRRRRRVRRARTAPAALACRLAALDLG